MSSLVRVAEEKDFPQILAIWQEGIIETFPEIGVTDKMLQKFKNNFSQREAHHFWIAEDEDIILGWQSYLPCTNNPVKAELYAEGSTYIQKNYRGKGVAFKLYRAALNYLKNHTNIMYIFGFVAPDNEPAFKIAHAFGFNKIGLIEGKAKGIHKIDTKIFVVNHLDKDY
jgi:phosphinothricin acetyltransferase